MATSRSGNTVPVPFIPSPFVGTHNAAEAVDGDAHGDLIPARVTSYGQRREYPTFRHSFARGRRALHTPACTKEL